MKTVLREFKRDTPLPAKGASLITKFLEFLKKEGCSPATCKNYLADLRHFFNFLDTKRVSQLSPQVFLDYKRFLTTTPLSLKSINRRLSTLRKFGRFLALTGATEKNPAAKITNVSPLAKKLAEIKTQKIPELKKSVLFFALTIFLIAFSLINLSVVRRHPSPPSSPQPKPVLKTLTFQGQLTDEKGRPRTSLALATFRLWDQKAGGDQLYSSGYCFIKPDQNGLFSIAIGQDCGKKIPASFFTKYERIYLEMEVEGEKRQARIQILNTTPTLFAFPETLSPTPTRRTEDDQILEKTLNLLKGLHLQEEGATPSGGSSLLEKQGRLATQGDFEVSGKIIDGGLGIFGIDQGSLPSTFDFTKGLTLEFDFQTGKEGFEAMLTTEAGKSYYCAWDKSGAFSIGKIIAGVKDEFLKVEKTWQEDAWFHARIALQQSILSFKVSGTSISAPLDLTSVPLTKTGTIKFGEDLKSITSLRIFSGEKTLLSSGEAEIEKNLQVKGALTANLSGQSSTNEVCWQGNMDAAQLVACSGGADLAEYYEAESNVEEGDVVSIQTTDEREKTTDKVQLLVGKSSRPYDPNLIGVISTLPWRIMGTEDQASNPKPVALAGRVPVKVKGEIKVGDPLTSSETPGVAQKATQEGLILGRALEPCQPTDDTGSWTSFDPVSKELASADCKILAFINISWYKPEPSYLARNRKTSEVSEDLTSEVKEVGDTSEVEKLESETLLKLSLNENLSLPGDLTVLGKTSLGQTSIAGSLMVDGSLTLDRSSINNLFGPLKLQSLGQENVEFLNGKIVIDQQGNLKVQGKILAQEIQIQKLTIKENAGTAILPAGQTQLLITPDSLNRGSSTFSRDNYSITPNSLIFLTPLTSTGNQTLYVKEKNPGESFVVGIDKRLEYDLPFNWLIVN